MADSVTWPEPPVPCVPGTILLPAFTCDPNGDGFTPTLLPLSEINTTASGLVVKTPCGGPCPRTEAIKTAREMKWTADELVKILKALG